MSPKYIGEPVLRREDDRMIRGLGTYVDDIRPAGLHHMAILRSPLAHARVVSVDTSRALGLAGVRGVFTGADTRGLGPVPRATVLPPDATLPRHPVLAENVVRFVGEPIAAVVASSPAVARDALELIDVSYDELPVISDPHEALHNRPGLVHSDLGTNVAFTWRLGGGPMPESEAWSSANRTFALRIEHQRLVPSAIEPRGVVAVFDPGRRHLTLWTSTQIPHFVRTFVALMLDHPESGLRVVAPDVGGGFGSKLNVYREEALACFAAMRLGVPVKWIERRTENFQATAHGRGHTGEIEVSATPEGKILGLRYRILADLGAYHQLLTPAIPAITGLMMSGPYDIGRVDLEVTGVYTNRMSTDAYRGAGRPEATYVLERTMDHVAAELGLHPAAVRRVNFIASFPHTTATGLVYDSGDYGAALDRAIDEIGLPALEREREKARARGRLFGIGLSSYVEICALGPSKGMPTGGFGWESALVRVAPTGSVTVFTGTCPHGQGQETAFAQIAAERLGIDIDAVTVLKGDTATLPYGVGTFGSRALVVGGTAVLKAADRVAAKVRTIAAHRLGVAPDVLSAADGVLSAGDRRLTFAEVAFMAWAGSDLPPGMEPGLEALEFHEPGNFTFPFGAHICAAEVDPETGRVTIVRYVAVDDCGRVVNPMLVEGQIHGGIAQGIGQALIETAVYDENGQLLTSEFTDYALPRAHDLPRFECARTETPAPGNPLGAKGVGEAGTIGATPAVVNAVIDALRPLGVKHLQMPLRPERVWRAIRGDSR